MVRPSKLDFGAVDAWIRTHAGWVRTEAARRKAQTAAPDAAIAKEYAFPDFVSALSFVVRVGCYAEKADHHPDIELGWGRARVLWSTHDAGGVTPLDVAAAEATDVLAG